MFDIYLFTAIVFALCAAVALLVTIRVNKDKKTKNPNKEDEGDFQSMITQINMANYSRVNSIK